MGAPSWPRILPRLRRSGCFPLVRLARRLRVVVADPCPGRWVLGGNGTPGGGASLQKCGEEHKSVVIAVTYRFADTAYNSDILSMEGKVRRQDPTTRVSCLAAVVAVVCLSMAPARAQIAGESWERIGLLAGNVRTIGVSPDYNGAVSGTPDVTIYVGAGGRWTLARDLQRVFVQLDADGSSGRCQRQRNLLRARIQRKPGG